MSLCPFRKDFQPICNTYLITYGTPLQLLKAKEHEKAVYHPLCFQKAYKHKVHSYLEFHYS